MSSSTSDPAPARAAVVSDNLADMTVPGVAVRVDAGEAEAMGAFEETALTEAEAWEANADLDADT